MKLQRAAVETAERAEDFPRLAELGHGLPAVVRLGLAARGNTHLAAQDVAHAVARGVNYLNWCGYDDGLAQAVRARLFARERVAVAMQLSARSGRAAERELESSLRRLGTGCIDVVTFYYVEKEREWEEICGRDGALEVLWRTRRERKVKAIGLTTHQRPLGARWAESGKLDLLMVRYNAAHRGAEQDVFPAAQRLQIPAVVYTAQRWGALSKPTRDDPAGFVPPSRPGVVPLRPGKPLCERGSDGAEQPRRAGGQSVPFG